MQGKEQWEFSKRLTSRFFYMFVLHLLALLVSAMLRLGDYNLVSDSFKGALPFYAVIFTGYTIKAGFENFDKGKNKVALKELEQDDGSCG